MRMTVGLIRRINGGLSVNPTLLLFTKFLDYDNSLVFTVNEGFSECKVLSLMPKVSSFNIHSVSQILFPKFLSFSGIGRFFLGF